MIFGTLESIEELLESIEELLESIEELLESFEALPRGQASRARLQKLRRWRLLSMFESKVAAPTSSISARSSEEQVPGFLTEGEAAKAFGASLGASS